MRTKGHILTSCEDKRNVRPFVRTERYIWDKPFEGTKKMKKIHLNHLLGQKDTFEPLVRTINSQSLEYTQVGYTTHQTASAQYISGFITLGFEHVGQ